MSPDSIVLSAQGIAKDYVLPNERIEVLIDVNLAVRQGEMVSIIGPSGSGKSTLLNILGTLDYPTKGKIFLNGKDLIGLNGNQQAEIRSRYIGFVFQFHHLLPEFNLLENVALPSMIAGYSKKKNRQRTTELIEKMGLTARVKHRPSQLSGGEKQRVAVARALINSPQLLLADEPTGNLDMANGQMLMDIFQKLKKEDKLAIIMVTHNQNIAAYADRILNLRDRRLYDM